MHLHYRSEEDALSPHRTLKGHVGEITALAFSADSQHIVSTYTEGQFCIRSVLNDRRRGDPFGKGNSPLWSVAFTPSGELVLAGSDESMIHIYDTTSRSYIRSLVGHEGPVFSIAITTNGEVVISGSQDGTSLWSLEPGDQLTLLIRSHIERVQALTLSPDSMQLASGSRNILLIWGFHRMQKLVWPQNYMQRAHNLD